MRTPCAACGYSMKALEDLCQRVFLEDATERSERRRSLLRTFLRRGTLEEPVAPFGGEIVLLPSERNLLLRRFLKRGAGRRKPWAQRLRRHLHWKLFLVLGDPAQRSRPVGALRELSNLLSDTGDSFLSCAVPHRLAHTLNQKLLRLAIATISLPATKDEEDGKRRITDLLDALAECPRLSKIEEAILYYVLAAGFYKIAGDYKSHSHQLTKVLYVVREAVSAGVVCQMSETTGEVSCGKALAPPTIKSLKETLAARIIRGIYRTYESTHRVEIEKLKAMLVDADALPYRQNAVYLNNLSMARELREVIVILHEIQLTARTGGGQGADGGSEEETDRSTETSSDVVEEAEVETAQQEGAEVEKESSTDTENKLLVELLTSTGFISPYGMVNSMYNRIHELRFRARQNYEILKTLRCDALLSPSYEAPSADWLDAIHESDDWLGRADEILGKIPGPLGDVGPDEVKHLKVGAALEHLIVDSIFCLHEVLRCLKTFGLSYMANHSMRAATHDKLAQWCDALYNYLKLYTKEPPKRKGPEPPDGAGAEIDRFEDERVVYGRMKEQLEEAIGPADLVTLTPSYHRERALLHYRATSRPTRRGAPTSRSSTTCTTWTTTSTTS